jgi:hypothetical protein
MLPVLPRGQGYVVLYWFTSARGIIAMISLV